ncbi:hypothetical protein VTN00DRAFT_7104 [Thermoascus crustaceus]|uniref:uncharacterized protein n=1 Tax=Thermoascus crustaceus TaxID=5088 RepID=UPI0037425219
MRAESERMIAIGSAGVMSSSIAGDQWGKEERSKASEWTTEMRVTAEMNARTEDRARRRVA